MMSREQVSISELLLSLDSSDLQEAEQVRSAVNQQLNTDRGGAVLSLLVEYYLDSSSSQAVLLLSSIREPHHKPLLEKLNESLNRTGTRPAALTLLGHLIRKQPPWVHHISRSALLPSLLRCLKTDTDVVVLVTGVLVLITLLPMIPQAGKQHIYDFFDVFGRLASWSYKNPGHVAAAQLVHLHAGVYSLFHRLYGMFPCNFISYLRLHYSMKENLDTYQEVIKPMLEHIRVHPELVTGTQDYELDPSRWRCYEVHDIVIECSRVSLDPLESSCEEDIYSSSSSKPPLLSHPQLDLTPSPPSTEPASISGSSVCPSLSSHLPWLTLSTSCAQADDVTWSPASHCGLSTPPPEPAAGSAHTVSRSTSVSGGKCPSASSTPVTPSPEDSQDGGPPPDSSSQVRTGPRLDDQVKQQPGPPLDMSSFQPITDEEHRGLSDVVNNNNSEGVKPEESHAVSSSSERCLLTSTPTREELASGLSPPPCSISLCLTPPHPSTHRLGEETSSPFGPTQSDFSSAPSYEPLFELALPRAATLFIRQKTQEALQRAADEQEKERRAEGEEWEQDPASISPLKVLDQLIVHGHDAHKHLSRRWSVERSQFGGPAQGEELQSLRSQLLLVQGQLQYERFKRQQHAVRNRRLLRRVINATALEEHSVAMKGQLAAQDEEIRCLKLSLDEEQRRHTQLKQEAHTHTEQLHTHIQQLQLQQQDGQRESQRLQSELQESQTRMRELEAELQRANNKAYNAEHQLTQLSLKLCSSEQLQQQMFLLNQQLVLLRETNRALTDQLEGGETQHWTEASMLQCSVGKEYQRLKDNDVQQRQKLEAANHRIAELENQLTRKDKLILDQKILLEDTKSQSRADLSASDSRCVALRRVAQTLQMEMLQLYSQLDTHTHSPPQDVLSRPLCGSRGGASPAQGVSSSAVINGAAGALSTSPLHLPSCSSSPLSLSPIESPLAVGSFLEQRSRHLFRTANQSPEEEEEQDEQEEQEEEAHTESPCLGQEAEEASLLAGSPQTEPPSLVAAPAGAPPDLTLAVRQRRHELSIMDYNETLPEF
ncbi:hamartin-like isoform X2 [Parambassis ranga]|uniref:Hamartin-like isoform X2 n=1 Tax=Parambassis ranga TaxID=210632 RepID=A0A6P7IZW2_9TELE|nr:hamartin-like isoform X2 [Parambassis ranga]